MFSDLPDELLLNVAAHLSERDLNAVAQTASRFFRAFDHYLYRQNAPSSFALWWAARYNKVQTARKAIQACATGKCRAPKPQGGRPGHRFVYEDLSTGLSVALSAQGRWCTPLFLAASRGSDDVVELLLEMDSVDANHRGMFGQTPIVAAIVGRHSGAVKLLLNSDGIDPNAADVNGFCPLFYAVRWGRPEIARLLLDSRHVNPDFACGWEKRTSLSYAAGHGFHSITEMLLCTNSVDPDSRDRNGKTPFTWAVEHGQADTARLLLETGRVDVNARSFSGDWTPLNRAIVCNPDKPSEEVIHMLAEHEEVDLNTVSAGNTPLGHVIMRNMVAQVKKLMDSGRVDPNAVGAMGMTALHIAASLGRVDIVKVLLGYDSVDCNAISGDGFTPLGTAAYRGHGAIVELLLRSGRVTDVNARCGNSGGTSLWWAAAAGRKAAVKAFLLYGSEELDVRSTNDDGVAPLEIAESLGFRKVERKIRKYLLAGSRRYSPGSTEREFWEAIGYEGVLGSLFDMTLSAKDSTK